MPCAVTDQVPKISDQVFEPLRSRVSSKNGGEVRSQHLGRGERGGDSITHRLTIESKRYRCWEYHQAPKCNTCKRLVPMFVTGLFTPHASPSLPLNPCRVARFYPSNAGPPQCVVQIWPFLHDPPMFSWEMSYKDVFFFKKNNLDLINFMTSCSGALLLYITSLDS